MSVGIRPDHSNLELEVDSKDRQINALKKRLDSNRISQPKGSIKKEQETELTSTRSYSPTIFTGVDTESSRCSGQYQKLQTYSM